MEESIGQAQFGMIDREHEVAVVTHYRAGAHINGKHFGQLENPGSDPVPTMGEISPGLHIEPTKKLTPHAAGDDVIVRRGRPAR